MSFLLPAYGRSPERLIVPAQSIIALTTGTVDPATRGLYVGASGTIGFIDVQGNTSNAVPVIAGTVLPFQITSLTSVSTTASVYALR